MAGTKEDCLYLNPDTGRWGVTYSRGAPLRLLRTIVFSYGEYNYNRLEKRVGEDWQPVTNAEYAALSPREQGHQWMISPTQDAEGAIAINVTMARVADDVFAQLGGYKAKWVMTLNFTLSQSPEQWERLAKRAADFGVDIIDLSVNMAEVDAWYDEAMTEWRRMNDWHQRAMALVQDISVDGLLELETLTEQCRRASARYQSARSRIVAAHAAIEQEPGRLPEKAILAARMQELPDETPLASIVALSKGAAAEQAMVLKMATPRERQAALIASLLNEFFGTRLVEARQESLILYNGNRPAGIITKGRLDAYREGR